jgi:hypothetical protein
MNRIRPSRRLPAAVLMALLCLLLVGIVLAAAPTTVGQPTWVGGASGGSDQRRDADVMPAVAYDPTTRQYLAVWLSPRRADSNSDGLDLIGVFLDQQGRPTGAPFYISDNNNVARNARPAVAAGSGGRFAVVWTVRGNPCRIAAELVTTAKNQTDRFLIAEAADAHAPDVVYQPSRDNFLLTFSSGEDYLPPTLLGADTADCGNNVSSTARIDVAEFAFINGVPMASRRVALSGAHGAFRPRIAYSPASASLLVIWEDRRAGSTEQPNRFDVYAQRLSPSLAAQGGNLLLAADNHYYLEDDSATWTPRPVVAAGNSGFLTAWFDHEPQGASQHWSVQAALVPATGASGTPFSIAATSYSQQHLGEAPSGSLSLAYSRAASEYLVGFTIYTESFFGYLSSALVQRVSTSGQLLRVDGSLLSEPGVGRAVDYAVDNQLFIALAENPNSGADISDVLVLYSKRLPGGHARDMDIFGARLTYPASAYHYAFLPAVTRPR